MPRQLRAMGKRKPSLDMRYLLIMMRAEETAIQPRQAPAVIACTGQPLRRGLLLGNAHAKACHGGITLTTSRLLATRLPWTLADRLRTLLRCLNLVLDLLIAGRQQSRGNACHSMLVHCVWKALHKGLAEICHEVQPCTR